MRTDPDPVPLNEFLDETAKAFRAGNEDERTRVIGLILTARYTKVLDRRMNPDEAVRAAMGLLLEAVRSGQRY